MPDTLSLCDLIVRRIEHKDVLARIDNKIAECEQKMYAARVQRALKAIKERTANAPTCQDATAPIKV
jgi:hypothetical protein